MYIILIFKPQNVITLAFFDGALGREREGRWGAGVVSNYWGHCPALQWLILPEIGLYGIEPCRASYLAKRSLLITHSRNKSPPRKRASDKTTSTFVTMTPWPLLATYTHKSMPYSFTAFLYFIVIYTPSRETHLPQSQVIKGDRTLLRLMLQQNGLH